MPTVKDQQSTHPSTIAIIPARGGSKGIPRKNVRFLHGRPLISYTIETALRCQQIDRVIVSTDDDEIAHVAQMYGAEVIPRPTHLAEDSIPLDPVIHHAVSTVEQRDGLRFSTVITMQPTSPLLAQSTVDQALCRFSGSEVDTLISVVDDRHLSWTKQDSRYVPLYQARVNRQYLPANFRETGGFVIARREHVTDTSRFGPRIDLFEISHTEAVDIDGYMDWWLADKLLDRKRLVFRANGYAKIGLGHIYRTLMLAGKLIDHELLFVTLDDTQGAQKIKDSHYPCRTYKDETELWQIINDFNPHIIINDVLDTDAASIRSLLDAGRFVVNFEDLGEGAHLAHAVINALYEYKSPADNFYFGKDYYCLRDEFSLLTPRPLSESVQEVLITFGGTDPNDYTRRVLTVLDKVPRKDFRVTLVTGLGYENFDTLKETMAKVSLEVELLRDIRNISLYMQRADLIFTSAGRTVFEVASLGTPLIVMAQNEREMTHTFAREENGIVHLGLGYQQDDETISSAFERLRGDFSLRNRYRDTMLNQNLRKGMDNVLKLIFSKYEQFDEARFR